MASLERDIPSEDTQQSQWVGEAAIKGRSQVCSGLGPEFAH